MEIGEVIGQGAGHFTANDWKKIATNVGLVYSWIRGDFMYTDSTNTKLLAAFKQLGKFHPFTPPQGNYYRTFTVTKATAKKFHVGKTYSLLLAKKNPSSWSTSFVAVKKIAKEWAVNKPNDSYYDPNAIPIICEADVSQYAISSFQHIAASITEILSQAIANRKESDNGALYTIHQVNERLIGRESTNFWRNQKEVIVDLPNTRLPAKIMYIG